MIVPLWARHRSWLQKLQKLYLQMSRSAPGAEMSGLLREFLLVPYLVSVFCHMALHLLGLILILCKLGVAEFHVPW